MPEDIDLGNGLMLRRLPEGSYTYPKTIPTEETPFDSDPFARAALRMRQGVKGRQQLPVDEPTPYKAPSYVMEPDLLEAQQGAHLPTGIAYNDAGIPFNKATGVELPTVARPNVLPIARTPDGLTLAIPKALDIFGNMMGGVAGAPVKGAEVLLGSGPVRKVVEEAVSSGPFFSALERAVDNSKVGKASADQWLGYLKNQPGVKQEELSTVLGGIEGQLTKQHVQKLVKQNKVELGEKVLGQGTQYKLENDNGVYKIINTETGNIKYAGLTSQKEAEALLNAENGRFEGNTKYHSYQLSGGENYKETLLTLPDKVKAIEKEFDAVIGDGVPWGKGKLYSDEIKRGLINEDLGIADLPEAVQSSAKNFLDAHKNNNNFKSSHWDEPNIIAHIRHNDRMVDGKKTLHLEEIQSDWHQKGRNEGYKLSNKQRKDLDVIEGKLTSKLTEAEIGNPDIDNVLKVAVEKKVITQDEARNYKDYVKGENSTVPDAPFKKNWDELALKKMLHKAANEGYEGLSWTPGEAQAARYDLSKQIDSIAYNPNTGYFKALDKSGKDISTGPVPKDKLADTIGKEAAEKLLKTEPNNVGIHSLQNADLKIGGEGMKSFYDKMLVDRANNLAKKYGSKVEQKFVNADKNEKLGKGSVTERAIGGYRVEYPNGLAEVFRDKVDAEKSLANWKSDKNQPIHYLPITPELRAKAKEGFPLFSSVPITVPVQGNPFEDQKKQYKLTPVEGNPFDHKTNAAGIESHRSNGGRADLDRPISPGPAPSYGLRPAIMDTMLPDYEKYQPNSIE